MHFDLKVLFQLQTEKLVRIQPHPTDDLWVVNYTDHVQLGRLWDTHEYLPHCRGLILDGEGNVVAKPFKKFFNVGEFPEINVTTLAGYGRPEIAEKLDGSMCVLYPCSTGYALSTRGTFTSEQALAATAFWERNHSHVTPADYYTYIFEYTASTNRIVVRYGSEALTLIGVTDLRDGSELSPVQVKSEAKMLGVPFAPIYEVDSWQVLKDHKQDNFEGFVLFWPDRQVRVKVKLEEYLVLHRIRSNMTDKFVWEAFRTNTDLTEMQGILEAEDLDWFNRTVARFASEYGALLLKAELLVGEITALALDPTTRDGRKSAALLVQQRDPSLMGLVMGLLDGRSVSDRIWKMLEPK